MPCNDDIYNHGSATKASIDTNACLPSIMGRSATPMIVAAGKLASSKYCEKIPATSGSFSISCIINQLYQQVDCDFENISHESSSIGHCSFQIDESLVSLVM